MRFACKALTAGLTLTLMLSPCVPASAARQKSRSAPRTQKKGKAAPKKPEAEPVSEVARLREQLVQATKEYKSSLAILLTHYEADVKRADERVIKSRELFEAGLVSKRALDEDALAAETARAKVARVEGQLKSADVQIAETLVEAEAEEAAAKALAKAKSAPRASGGLLTTTGYIRYGGARAWSLGEAGSVDAVLHAQLRPPAPRQLVRTVARPRPLGLRAPQRDGCRRQPRQRRGARADGIPALVRHPLHGLPLGHPRHRHRPSHTHRPTLAQDHAALTGRRISTTKPPPDRFSALTVPPWSRTARSVMASPSPVPPVSRVRESSMR